MEFPATAVYPSTFQSFSSSQCKSILFIILCFLTLHSLSAYFSGFMKKKILELYVQYNYLCHMLHFCII